MSQPTVLVATYAEIQGYTAIIEASGARIISGMCAGSVTWTFLRDRGFTAMATNSPKLAYGTSLTGLATYYGSLSQCVGAAIKGYWEYGHD